MTYSTVVTMFYLKRAYFEKNMIELLFSKPLHYIATFIKSFIAESSLEPKPCPKSLYLAHDMISKA